MINIKHLYNKELLPFIDSLTSSTSIEELFQKQNKLYDRLNNINLDYLNSNEKIYYFCSALAINSVYRLFHIKGDDQAKLLVTVSIMTLFHQWSKETTEVLRRKFKKQADNEELSAQVPEFIIKQIPNMRVNDEILKNKLAEKSSLLVTNISEGLYSSCNKISKTVQGTKADAVLEYFLRLKLLPESFKKKILPILTFVNLYDSSQLLRSLNDSLLFHFFEKNKIQTEVKSELDYNTCTYYLNLAFRYKFNFDVDIQSLLSFEQTQDENTEIDIAKLKFLNEWLFFKPDFFLENPGFIICFYNALTKLDIYSLKILFACKGYDYIHATENTLLEEFGCTRFTNLDSKDEKKQSVKKGSEKRYHKNNNKNNSNQNLLYTFIYFGILKLLASEKTKYSEIIGQLVKGISQKKYNDFSYLVKILNQFSRQFGFNKENPFENISFESQKNPAVDNKEVAVNCLYMLLHTDSLDSIYHGINFVREEQKKVLNCVPNRYFNYDSEEEALAEIAKTSRNHEILKKIDSGFNFEFLQRPGCFKIAGIKDGVRRIMTCKLFSETDKNFKNIHQYKGKRNKYKIDYEEDFRLSNENRFSNYYLYTQRNTYTHHSYDPAVFALLDDSKPKHNFFDAMIKIMYFFGKQHTDSNINESEKKIYEFYFSWFWGLIYNVLCKFAPELSFSYKEPEKGLRAVFDSKGNLKKEYNDRAADFSLEQNLSPVEIDGLRKIMEFAFLSDSDVIAANKVSVVMYIIYMCMKLTTIH